jgi:hypothetical protein
VPGLLSVGLASFPASVVAGGQATIGITIARSGSFTGPVTLAVEGAPSGVTASLSASVLAAGVTSATLTVQVGANVAAGSYPLTVRASGAGVPEQTAVTALVVTAPPPVPTLTVASSTGSVTVVQNTSSAAITLTLTRGGGLTGGATMSLEGAPSGVSGVFTPNPATDASTALVISATTAVAPGSYPLTVRATIGSVSATTALSLTVQPAPAPMPVVWQFCADGRPPIWFAFRDGTTGPWTRVLPDASNRFAFTLADTRASVTFVRDSDGGFDITEFDVVTFHQSRAELIALGTRQCQETPGSRTLTGTVAGLGLGQAAAIVAGGATGGAGLNGVPYTVRNVRNGPLDLLAARTGVTLATLATDPDRFILRRSITPPAGGAMPLLDFASAESFAPATATYTIGNVLGARMALTTSFVTANGTVGSFVFGPQLVGPEARTVYGVPLSLTQPGDLHAVLVNAVSGTDIVRQVTSYHRELSNRSFTLGPPLTVPAVTTLGTAPYLRARAVGAWQSDYNQTAGVLFEQGAAGGRSWSVFVSPAFAGGTSYELEMPDLGAASGFSAAWGLQPGVATTWTVSASRLENAPQGVPVDNARSFMAARLGRLP